LGDLIIELLRWILPDPLRGMLLIVVGMGLVGLSGYLVYESLMSGTSFPVVLVLGGLAGAAFSFCLAFISFHADDER
jgi:cyanate permease